MAESIMREVVKASSVPVSVKIRLGWDDESINVLDMARRGEFISYPESFLCYLFDSARSMDFPAR